MDLIKISRRIAVPLVDAVNIDPSKKDKFYDLFKALDPKVMLYQPENLWFPNLIATKGNPYDLKSIKKMIFEEGRMTVKHDVLGYNYTTRFEKLNDPNFKKIMDDLKRVVRPDAINVVYTTHLKPDKAMDLAAEWFAHDLGHLAVRNDSWKLFNEYSEKILNLVIENSKFVAYDPYRNEAESAFRRWLTMSNIVVWVDESIRPTGASFSRNLPHTVTDLLFDFMITYVKTNGKLPEFITVNPVPLYYDDSKGTMTPISLIRNENTVYALEPGPQVKSILEPIFNEFFEKFQDAIDEFFKNNLGKILIFD